jgi:predicted RNA binding protein YcfA (HicA-like mRNA interferase family)
MPSNISRKKLIKKLKALGFTGPFSGGKHQFMKKGQQKIRIPNPHQGEISISLVKEILRQAGIRDRDWDDA